MTKFKKILIISMVIVIVVSITGDCSKRTVSAKPVEKPAKAAVFLLDFTDDLISLIKNDLEDIQKKEGNVEYTFYDGKSDQSVQDESIDKVLKEGTDLIILNIVDRGASQRVIDKIKASGIPVILFNREPLTPYPVQSYTKAVYIGTDGKQAGDLQAEMLIDTWKNSKDFIDKNGDNVMQYVMLQGESDSTEAIDRTKYSIRALENSGIKTQQVALKICNWLEGLAYDAIKSLYVRYRSDIDVIIANDDTMAIGAIKSLHEYDLNKGDKMKTIPVVGVDVTPEAKELIEKGEMLGSVYQPAREYAEALYACGMNLIAKKSPIEGTEYKFDDTGAAIRLPHPGYLYKNIFPVK